MWGEEFSKYRSAHEWIQGKFSDTKLVQDGWYTFLEDAMLMDAKVAACRFDYTDLPSAYCMFETFDPNDKQDETTEDAESWLQMARMLPDRFAPQVERIWSRWLEARKELEQARFDRSFELRCGDMDLDGFTITYDGSM